MNPTHQDWSPVAKRDAARRAQTRALLAAGKLQAGVDYERAAFVFQHGTTAEDHLFAHVLALVALGKRDVNARWIAAATLDGYLAEIGKPQLFGARFNDVGGKAIVEEPFNRTLLSDDIRKLFDVPAIADQAAEYQKSMQAFGK